MEYSASTARTLCGHVFRNLVWVSARVRRNHSTREYSTRAALIYAPRDTQPRRPPPPHRSVETLHPRRFNLNHSIHGLYTPNIESTRRSTPLRIAAAQEIEHRTAGMRTDTSTAPARNPPPRLLRAVTDVNRRILSTPASSSSSPSSSSAGSAIHCSPHSPSPDPRLSPRPACTASDKLRP